MPPKTSENCTFWRIDSDNLSIIISQIVTTGQVTWLRREPHLKSLSDDFWEKMQEEATFNYGKLSAEAGFEREAINTLSKIDKSSPYYKESDRIVGELLENMSDYTAVMQIIDGMSSTTDKIKLVYQNAALKLGMQAYNSGMPDDALKAFEKSKSLISAKRCKLKIHSGSVKSNMKRAITKLLSKDLMTILISPMALMACLMNHLPSVPITLKDTTTWCWKNTGMPKSFKNVLVGFNLNSTALINKDLSNKIWPDAIIRTGDCLFKSRKFQDAVGFYSQAINKNKEILFMPCTRKLSSKALRVMSLRKY